MKTTLFLGKWLTLAFVLESLMAAYVPAEWITQALGGEGLLPIATSTVESVFTWRGDCHLPVVR